MSIKINPVKSAAHTAAKKQTQKIVIKKSALPLEAPLPDFRDRKLADMLDPSAPMQNALNKIEVATQYIKNVMKK